MSIELFQFILMTYLLCTLYVYLKMHSLDHIEAELGHAL